MTKVIKANGKTFIFEITKQARADYRWDLVSVDGDESLYGACNIDMKISNMKDAVDGCRRHAEQRA